MAAYKALENAVSREGKNRYTQTEKRYLAGSGWSDCSSLMYWAYKMAYGIDIGTWTGEQVRKGERVAYYGGKATLTEQDCRALEPGDLVFFGSGDAKHVEMYVGNNRLFGHGSATPSYKNALTYRHSAGVYQARRYWSDDTNKEKKEGFSVNLGYVRNGCSGNVVEFLQALLNLYGYSLAVDGDFGALTEKAVYRFQTANKLEKDGIVGPETWKALFNTLKYEKENA